MATSSPFAVGFLGYGRMAQAISYGLNQSGTIPFANQAASDLDATSLSRLSQERGFTAFTSNQEVVDSAEVVVVAVKPHQVKGLLTALRPDSKSSPLFISIAAGVTLTDLSNYLSQKAKIVRVLPNLPALVGRGVALVCAPKGADPANVAKAQTIFDSVGTTRPLPESLFDVGTAVSGSGPAYFFLAMEALVRGAVRLGLTFDVAKELVLRTAQGAAEAAIARPDLSLADLRDQVTSPGGTTAEALYVLEEGALTALLQKALAAATDKAKKLA
ncbi:MAG: pyrroline-5-carboxylate reductase [Deltaproteobacteria bacterium]|jgi:pyrroline-5-carboxylate reductase|nr:pyrroline-5-carboxylate reductase [Deltaproteobacteria bacterium]